MLRQKLKILCINKKITKKCRVGRSAELRKKIIKFGDIVYIKMKILASKKLAGTKKSMAEKNRVRQVIGKQELFQCPISPTGDL